MEPRVADGISPIQMQHLTHYSVKIPQPQRLHAIQHHTWSSWFCKIPWGHTHHRPPVQPSYWQHQKERQRDPPLPREEPKDQLFWGQNPGLSELCPTQAGICSLSLGPFHYDKQRQIRDGPEIQCPLDTWPIPKQIKCHRYAKPSGLAQSRNEARRRMHVNDVQDEQWIGSRRHDVIPGASCGNRCQCSSASFHHPPNFQSTTTKFLLPSLCKTMGCTAGYGCPGTLAGILQTAGVPDQPLRLKLTKPTSLPTIY